MLVAGLVAGCSAESAPRATIEVPVPVSIVQAVPAGGQSSLDISGTVRLKRETPLGFNGAGRIAAILVNEGDQVSRGQVLARLDPTSLAAASTSARAEADRADADYKRLASLFKQGWVTAPRVETARASAAAARAQVAQASFDVGLATIRAPSAGVVLRRPAEPGQMVTPGTTVVIVGERASGYVLRVPIADGDLSRVAVGQSAAVTIPALGAVPIVARVTEIGARGDDVTGTFRVELALPPQPGLRSGQIGRATLRFGGVGPVGGAVTVPATAVFAARADEGFVYVHDAAAGKVRLRQVAIGPVGDAALTVTAGLRPGEPVVTSGVDRLRNGSRVTVKS
ncbi:hemolysin secretion protein D [Polymorphobacter glacialis]|uniref:Hemolysin secretion protein D n=1 Tax=Sandarakinorhabdus glacialis TaxID=1614636 RepID=A0A916ZHH4_9SPHN|nr:efflux RND transporter periplasmic adaptor subunit [Polymorphobacter glacialis]GGD98582.1 hemolysin secretion protein D [Polymorphobacter glacialis]